MWLFGPPNIKKLKKKRKVKGLIKALSYSKKGKDNAWKIRRSAALALGEIGATEAFDPLCTAAADWSPSVRLAAVQALSQLGSRCDYTLANVRELNRALIASQLWSPWIIELIGPLSDPAQRDQVGVDFPDGPLGIILGALVEGYLNATAGVKGFHFSNAADRRQLKYIENSADQVVDCATEIKQTGDPGYVPFLCCHLQQLQKRFRSRRSDSDWLRSEQAIRYLQSALRGVVGVDYGSDVERYLERWRNSA